MSTRFLTIQDARCGQRTKLSIFRLQKLWRPRSALLAVLIAGNVAMSVQPTVADSDFPDDPLAKGASMDVDLAWSGHPVGFSLLTLHHVQIASYYNQYRQMVVAARNLNSTGTSWQRLVLNSSVGWDSHNYITMTTDAAGHLHLSGNLHRNPMVYFRSAQPVASASQFVSGFMQQLPVLVNAANEAQATYPAFFKGPLEELVFSYRNHTSNTAGTWHLLKYEPANQTFAATAPQPIFQWTGNYSVYPAFVVDRGKVHCLFMWRGSPDASSNYKLSYMSSTNMTTWTNAFGQAVTLPVTPSTTLTTIDDVPQLGGLLNGQPKLAFDRDGKPLVSYHKYTAANSNALSQVYAARPDGNTWKIVQLTQSAMRWEFSGGGSLPPGGSVSNSFAADDSLDGLATIGVTMTDAANARDPSSGPYVLDEATLTPMILSAPSPTRYQLPGYNTANAPTSDNSSTDTNVIENTYTHNGTPMGIQRTSSLGVPLANQHYFLRWETLPANRDQPRLDANGSVIAPTPSRLKLFRTRCEFGNPTMSGSAVTGIAFKPSMATLAGAMARPVAQDRAFGAYLSSPSTSTSAYAEWNFNVTDDVDYALGGSTHSIGGTDDSFYIQLDNGPLVDWHCTGRWSYLPTTIGGSRGMTRFGLAPGPHRLRVYAREAGAKLEYLWLNLPNKAKQVSLWPLTSQGFSLTADASTVSGQVLSSAQGSTPAGFSANYQIPIPQSGNYRLLGRSRGIDANSDSFFISLNGGAQQAWHLPAHYTAWSWSVVKDSLALTAGNLDINVYGREGGAALDSFMVLKLP